MKKGMVLAGLAVFLGFFLVAAKYSPSESPEFQYQATKDLVVLVENAAHLVETEGEAAFLEFKKKGGPWQHGDVYVFILDTDGNMVVHHDPVLEGKNEIDLKDVNGRAVVRGLIEEVSGYAHKTAGWFHYEWPEPGSFFPVWKTTFAKLVAVPSGKKYIVCSGLYNMKMERKFVVDNVKEAVEQIEKNGEAAFQLLRDPTSPFLFKDTYVFVIGSDGTDLVHPGFPSLEGRNVLDLKDTQGKPLIREMIDLVQAQGSGWVDYMWPKPGDYVSTKKVSYVSRAKFGDKWVVVGCGVYLEGATQEVSATGKMSAKQVAALVREAAALLRKKGEEAFPQFREKGSKWFHGETYLFVWDMSGTRIFHAANPESEGENVIDMKDSSARPVGRMFLEIASSPKGEGWVHYLYPKPGEIFPTWKSTFLKRVKFPSGKEHLVGCGVYNMKIQKEFLVEVVDAAAALIEKEGKEAFKTIRDKAGPFVFLDTYVFVDTPDGTEWVNPAFPSVEGKNLMDYKDAGGKYLEREIVQTAMTKGAGWVQYLWPKPGESVPSRKKAYVKKVQCGKETFIVGSGAYLD